MALDQSAAAPPVSPRSFRRWLLYVVVGLLGLDIFAILSTGWSLTGADVSDSGLIVRLVALAALTGFCFWKQLFPGDRYHYILTLGLLASLFQFHATPERRVGDGFFYYAHLHSFWKDFDARLDNEYQLYGIGERSNLQQRTSTGYLRNNFSVGPAILWSPFFGMGELVGRWMRFVGRQDVNLLGNGPAHWNAVSLGSLLYGFAAVLLIQSLLRRYFSAVYAFAGAALVWLATSHHWYMVHQPIMSHATAAFVAAWFVWWWDGSRLARSDTDAVALGLIGGLAAAVRWQNGLIWLLPLFDWLRGARARDWSVVRRGPLFLLGVVLALIPQFIDWKLRYDTFLLLTPPQGSHYVTLSDPVVWMTLFSSRHGLFSWTPIAWLGFVGLIPLARRQHNPFLTLAVTLLIMTYVNMCITDWWGGGSYGNRRFDAALPMFAFGIAASCRWFHELARRRPGWMLAGLLAFFPIWNLLFMEQYRRYRIPPDNTVSFTEVGANNLEILFEKVGYPFAWPVNWLVAARDDLSFQEFDTVYGRYLFFPHKAVSTIMEIGDDDGGLVGDGWNDPEFRNERWVRVMRRRQSTLFVPLRQSYALDIIFTLSVRPKPVEVAVDVNGLEVGRFLATPGFASYGVETSALHWKAGINRLELRPAFDTPGQILLLDRVDFGRSRSMQTR